MENLLNSPNTCAKKTNKFYSKHVERQNERGKVGSRMRYRTGGYRDIMEGKYDTVGKATDQR